ncbi:hypothetical protein BHM03_00050135 [Ensete ventricosum]|nr:hypothetical protein BHM03_00050135 [Ensete ventricosum]
MTIAVANKISVKLGILCERGGAIWSANREKDHKERLKMMENRLDVLEVSLEELYQGQQRFLRLESLQEEAESWINKVESLSIN